METRALHWGVAAFVVLVGLFAPSTASALRKYVCESSTNGYCVATKDSRSVECQCTDEDVHVFDVPGLDTVSDQELEDACWSQWRETCLGPGTQNAKCEAEDRGECEASNSDKGWVDCKCADGRYDGDFNVPALKELEDDALEEACFEHLDEICAPAQDNPAPVGAPAAAWPRNDDTASGCNAGSGPASAWALVLLFGLSLRRGKANGRGRS